MPALTSSTRAKTASFPGARKKTVLVLEDEAFVREVTCEVLLAAGYCILEAGTVAEAKNLLAQTIGMIDLILCDVVLPDGSGAAFADAARKRFPAARVILASGYPPATLQQKMHSPRLRSTLSKPYCASRLIAKVREVLS